MRRPRYGDFRRRAWLWWLAGMFLVIGLMATCLIASRPFYSEEALLRIWLVCLLLTGLCVVSATADWWLK